MHSRKRENYIALMWNKISLRKKNCTRISKRDINKLSEMKLTTRISAKNKNIAFVIPRELADNCNGKKSDPPGTIAGRLIAPEWLRRVKMHSTVTWPIPDKSALQNHYVKINIDRSHQYSRCWCHAGYCFPPHHSLVVIQDCTHNYIFLRTPFYTTCPIESYLEDMFFCAAVSVRCSERHL